MEVKEYTEWERVELSRADHSFDLLVSVNDGFKNRLFIVRNTDAVEAVSVMSDMEIYSAFIINLAVELSREQTHYQDTSPVLKKRFHVSTEEGWVWLHDIPIWDMDKYIRDKDVVAQEERLGRQVDEQGALTGEDVVTHSEAFADEQPYAEYPHPDAMIEETFERSGGDVDDIDPNDGASD